MLTQIKKNILVSAMAIIGAGAVAAIVHLYLESLFPAHNLLASIIGSIVFAGLALPVPFYFQSSSNIVKAALYDSLTGLFNRAALSEEFKTMLAESTKHKKKFHLLMIDLNKFKQVNDTLGHAIGDQLLVQVASRLRESVREGDFVARLGGDEFAILLPDPDDVKSYEAVITKIAKNIGKPSKIDGNSLYINASIGVSTFPTNGAAMVALMRCADIAMYSAKRTQKDFCVYDIEDDKYKATDLVLLGELRAAIDDGDCELWFQPKLNVFTDKVDAVECLVRWRHPVRGIISPDMFIPIAETSGLIKNVTQFVVKQAAVSYSMLRDAGHDLNISINVSPIDIVDPALMTTIIKSIVKADMKPNKLILEVTETAIMHDPTLAFKTLIALESLGIRLSIDDFGTGHSSLMYLKNFPIYEVKLDKSFVSDIADSPEGYNIVKSTIELSHTLNAITTAEGVESAQIEMLLRELKCDYIQGFHIAKPMPMSQLILWLDDHK